MRISTHCILQVALAISLSVSASVAQQITGSVTGTVVDPTGATVSGAAIKLTNTGTGAAQDATTDGSGNFRFLLLPPGNYALQVTTSGFKTFRRDGIIIEVDRSIAVAVSLQIGQVSETVEVTGGSPLLEPHTSSRGTVMGEEKGGGCSLE